MADAVRKQFTERDALNEQSSIFCRVRQKICLPARMGAAMRTGTERVATCCCRPFGTERGMG
ncbi:MAG: hypothetical protein LLG97_02285 [Deltaproteobacteria bacterium]|nr:hypothetical protein [Deltaproteobacteria bacterium]